MTKKPAPPPRTVRLTAQGERDLAKLAKAMDTTPAEVIRVAVRKLAESTLEGR